MKGQRHRAVKVREDGRVLMGCQVLRGVTRPAPLEWKYTTRNEKRYVSCPSCRTYIDRLLAATVQPHQAAAPARP